MKIVKFTKVENGCLQIYIKLNKHFFDIRYGQLGVPAIVDMHGEWPKAKFDYI